MTKYGTFSDPYFPVFGLTKGKYGPEKTPYLDTFYAVTKKVYEGCDCYHISCNKCCNF